MIRDLSIFTPPLPLGRGRFPKAQLCAAAAPFACKRMAGARSWGEGTPGKVHQLFGDKLNAMIEELNETLAA